MFFIIILQDIKIGAKYKLKTERQAVNMLIKNSKVAIIGAGNVGVTTAFCLQNQGLCDEIILIDINRDKALGEVLDLSSKFNIGTIGSIIVFILLLAVLVRTCIKNVNTNEAK